jgi:hypothetical protein
MIFTHLDPTRVSTPAMFDRVSLPAALLGALVDATYPLSEGTHSASSMVTPPGPARKTNRRS